MYYQKPFRVRKDEGLVRKVYLFHKGDECTLSDDEIEKRGLLGIGAVGKKKPETKGGEYKTKIIVPEKNESPVQGVMRVKALDDVVYMDGTKEKTIKKGKTALVSEEIGSQLIFTGKAEIA